MSDTETSALHDTIIDEGVPAPRGTVTRVRRWPLATSMVNDAFRNPVRIVGTYGRVRPENSDSETQHGGAHKERKRRVTAPS